MSTNHYALNVSNDYLTYFGTEKPGSVFISNYRQAYPFEGIFSTYNNAGSRYMDIPFAEGDVTKVGEIQNVNDEIHSFKICNIDGSTYSYVNATTPEKALRLMPKGVYIVNGKKVVVK